MPTGYYLRDDRRCSLDNCDNKHVCRGYCNRHYQSFKKYGNAAAIDDLRSSYPEICVVEDCNRPTKHPTFGLCGMHYARKWRSGEVTLRSRYEPDGVDTRTCARCSTVRPMTEFRENSNGYGRMRTCRSCEQIINREWALRNPGKNKELQRIGKVRRAYGDRGLIILSRIDAGEGCENCGGRTTNMAIDHDHTTGQTRGLLCSNCNTALGLLKEDRAIILGLLNYMDRYK